MNLDANRNSWLVTIPIALAAAAYVWFIFLPGKRAIAELHTELQGMQMFAAGAAKTTAAIGQIQKLAQETQSYNVESQLPSPSSADMAQLYGEISEAIREAGLRTTRFAPEPPVKYDSIQKTPLRVGCVGSFAEVSRLLELIERLPSRVWTDSMSLQPDGENGEAVRCELTLGIFVDNPVISN